MVRLTPLADGPGYGQRSYFSICGTLVFLSSVIILTFCVSKLSQRLFRLKRRDLIEEVGRLPQPETTPQQRQAPSIAC
jgi:hypothetical protein